MKQQKTYTPRPGDIERVWWTVDATDLPLGRLASEVARVLRGKHKPQYTPHLDVGDAAVVVDADVDVLPASAARVPLGVDAASTVAYALEFPQLLDVEVEHVPGLGVLVADDWRLRFEC